MNPFCVKPNPIARQNVPVQQWRLRLITFVPLNPLIRPESVLGLLFFFGRLFRFSNVRVLSALNVKRGGRGMR